jgi:hypothetical protein
MWTTSIATAALVALPVVVASQTYPTGGSGQSTAGQSNPASPYSFSVQNTPQFHLDEAKRVLDSISTSDLTGDAASRIAAIESRFRDLRTSYKNQSGPVWSTDLAASSSSATSGQVGTSGSMPPAGQTASGAHGDWKTTFKKIEGDLDALNIPKSSFAPYSNGSSGPATSGMSGMSTGLGGTNTGTSGTTGSMSAATVRLSSEVRNRLEQFRTHLEEFYSLTHQR